MLGTLVLTLASTFAGEPITHTLISSSQGINHPTWTISSKDVSSPSPHSWAVRKRRLVGGKQEGVDLIEIDNGLLTIEVVPTRGLGIWQVRQGDLRLGWDSPVQEIVHPSLVSLDARGGLGWLEGFGEFLCRCGLENNGHPGPDIVRDNTGAPSTIELTLHGRQAYLPAQEVELSIDTDAPYTIRLRGVIAERMMHGAKLRLETVLSTEPGSNRFRLEDIVVNESANPTEYQILYHTNVGSPILNEGSRFVGPVRRVVPFNDRAAEGDIKTFARYTGPTAGYVEQVYCLDLYRDGEGSTVVGLVSAEKQSALSIRYETATLPYLTLWKNTAAKADGYVTGIEPGTNFPYARRLERQAGRVPKLGPGEKKTMRLEFALHTDRKEIDQLVEEIQRIQGNRPTEYVSEPNPPAEPETN